MNGQGVKVMQAIALTMFLMPDLMFLAILKGVKK